MAALGVVSKGLQHSALHNTDYRRVFATGSEVQVVLYSLQPGEILPKEVHEGVTQIMHIVDGVGRVDLWNADDSTAKTIGKGGRHSDLVIVNPGTTHRVENTSFACDLKLVSFYTAKEFAPDRVDERQPEDTVESHDFAIAADTNRAPGFTLARLGQSFGEDVEGVTVRWASHDAEWADSPARVRLFTKEEKPLCNHVHSIAGLHRWLHDRPEGKSACPACSAA